MNDRTPELLAPAGGMRQLVAAIENGADAVYLGGPLFNARIHADNFTEEEIRNGIEYAHLRDAKVYITLNTLLTDEELYPALQYAAGLYNMGADALILQDLGLADLIREFLPDFPIHLSTQGSVYNRSGVREAKKLGFSRVVLARELSLEEIRSIAEAKICDIEVFVHGALCMCYSGQCQLSRILGGGDRSGNRGLCAQPCRLPYTDETGKSTYALSPKDLCTIDHLGELLEAGVSSLKIEGRMKSAEYVAAVTGIYRKYLDLYCREGSYTVSQEDRKILMQVFNRGGFTTGYLEGNPGKRFLSGQLSKHQGIYIGRVVKRVPKSQLVDVKLEQPLAMGDGIEIRSGQLTGNVVTYIKPQNDGILRIGDIKGEVRPGDRIYKITDIILMRELRKTFEEGGPEGRKHRKTAPVNMRLAVKTGKAPELTIEGRGQTITCSDHEAVAEKAQHRPLTFEAAEKQLRKTGGTPFRVEKVEAELEADCSLPLSALNRLRRAGLAAFAEKKLARRAPASIPEKIVTEPAKLEKRLAFYFYNAQKFAGWNFKEAMDKFDVETARAYLPLQYYMEEAPAAAGVEVIPYVMNISKGKLDQYIAAHLEEIAEKVKPSGIAVGNLGWIEEFVSRGLRVYGDYGLNLYNERAIQAITRQGVVPISLSHELWNPACGPIPLMVTEYLPDSKRLQDRKKAMYKIVYNYEKDKAILFSDQFETKEIYQKNTWEKAPAEIRINIF